MTQTSLQVNINATIKGLSFSLLILLLAGCGFHLRGDYSLPPQMSHTYIEVANQNTELYRVLKRTLKVSGVDVVDSQQQAQSVLNMGNEQLEKRVLSVDTQGRAREYEINYQISFSVQANENKFSLAEQTLKLQRDFLFDTEDVLGKGREEATLIKDMQQDMVRLIMLRLQAAAEK